MAPPQRLQGRMSGKREAGRLLWLAPDKWALRQDQEQWSKQYARSSSGSTSSSRAPPSKADPINLSPTASPPHLQVLDVLDPVLVAAAHKAVHIFEVLALQGGANREALAGDRRGRTRACMCGCSTRSSAHYPPGQAIPDGTDHVEGGVHPIVPAHPWRQPTHLALLEQLLASLVNGGLLGGMHVDAVVLAGALRRWGGRVGG